nr:hypothetical protein [Acetobacterium wieringae]
MAGKLRTAIGMKNHSFGTIISAGVLKRFNTKVCPHVVIHLEAPDTAVITIKNGCQIKFSIFTGDFRDISKPFLIRRFRCEILFDEVFRLLRFGIGFRDPIGFALHADH